MYSSAEQRKQIWRCVSRSINYEIVLKIRMYSNSWKTCSGCCFDLALLCIVPCWVLWMFFSFLLCFPAGWTRTSRVAWHFSKNFFFSFPKLCIIIAPEEKVDVQCGRISPRNVLKYFWFWVFFKGSFKKVKTFGEGMWQVPRRRCSATILGDCEVWRLVLEAMKALPQVHETEQDCDRTVWFLAVVELIPSGLWYTEPVKVTKANEISVLSRWVSLTWTEHKSWGRRRKRQFMMRGNDLSLATT